MTWPASARQLDLASHATHAFDVLRSVLRRQHGDSAMREAIELDALCISSTVHGLAGVMNGQCIGELDLKANVLKRAVRHSMQRTGIGLAGKMWCARQSLHDGALPAACCLLSASALWRLELVVLLTQRGHLYLLRVVRFS